MNNSFSYIVQEWQNALPMLLGTGLCLAMVISKAHLAPRAAALAALGLGIVLAVWLLDPIAKCIAVNSGGTQPSTPQSLPNVLRMIYWARQISLAGAYFCLTSAVFTGRPAASEGDLPGYSGPADRL